MKLSSKLATLILSSVKQGGSYDPAEVLPRIEEQLTSDEYKTAEAFLTWVFQGITDNPEEFPGRRFGANIKDRFKEFIQSTKAKK